MPTVDDEAMMTLRVELRRIPPERPAWLHRAVAIGRGALDGSSLTVELCRAQP